VASLRASSSPFGLTTLSAELYADITPAVDADGVDAVNRGLTLKANRRLFFERLRGSGSFTLGQTEYVGLSSGADDDAGTTKPRDGRTDDYWGFSLGVDWWTKKNVSVGLAYSYTRREGSRGDDAETRRATSYESGRWTLRVSWNY